MSNHEAGEATDGSREVYVALPLPRHGGGWAVSSSSPSSAASAPGRVSYLLPVIHGREEGMYYLCDRGVGVVLLCEAENVSGEGGDLQRTASFEVLGHR